MFRDAVKHIDVRVARKQDEAQLIIYSLLQLNALFYIKIVRLKYNKKWTNKRHETNSALELSKT